MIGAAILGIVASQSSGGFDPEGIYHHTLTVGKHPGGDIYGYIFDPGGSVGDINPKQFADSAQDHNLLYFTQTSFSLSPMDPGSLGAYGNLTIDFGGGHLVMTMTNSPNGQWTFVPFLSEQAAFNDLFEYLGSNVGNNIALAYTVSKFEPPVGEFHHILTVGTPVDGQFLGYKSGAPPNGYGDITENDFAGSGITFQNFLIGNLNFQIVITGGSEVSGYGDLTLDFGGGFLLLLLSRGQDGAWTSNPDPSSEFQALKDYLFENEGNDIPVAYSVPRYADRFLNESDVFGFSINSSKLIASPLSQNGSYVHSVGGTLRGNSPARGFYFSLFPITDGTELMYLSAPYAIGSGSAPSGSLLLRVNHSQNGSNWNFAFNANSGPPSSYSSGDRMLVVMYADGLVELYLGDTVIEGSPYASFNAVTQGIATQEEYDAWEILTLKSLSDRSSRISLTLINGQENQEPFAPSF